MEQGGVASPRAASVAAAADLEEKKVAVADSAVSELGVTASSGPSNGPAEAGGEHVDLQQKEDLVGKRRKWDSSGYYPYDRDEDEPYECESGDDVVEGNVESFEEKVVQKIRAQGSGTYYNWRTDKYCCPYCIRPKPMSGLLEHLMEHCWATSVSSDEYKIRAQHSALHKQQATYQVVQPINGDPFIGSLETPVTSSPLVAWYLSNLPAYRTAISPLLRGIEVGLAHGYLLVGPFALTGPLRNTPIHGQAGTLGAIILVSILSVWLTMYGVVSFNEGVPSTAPTLTLTGRKKEADKLQTAEGWSQFTGGFFFGGVSGAIWAYFLLYVLDLPYFFK
ncbi:photosystem I reaction center subunit XI, chloroplastic-like [Triticum aestivum]|uniref:photosystem I reaction center subunit XI, chloroplastic-like n=1 Tax=Triticum aestivum TaxID=4565 RepID=UPI001D034E96|nr:photosystem I reaction center subunit XI, chloroplastic-like [Triticum aestivum]